MKNLTKISLLALVLSLGTSTVMPLFHKPDPKDLEQNNTEMLGVEMQLNRYKTPFYMNDKNFHNSASQIQPWYAKLLRVINTRKNLYSGIMKKNYAEALEAANKDASTYQNEASKLINQGPKKFWETVDKQITEAKKD